ncbi:MAG TPA: hypothetical protein VME46_10920 [Acidimicrobiales bacterium]|nr:hypothetical protein [Acidimicrobiales bacterium]
MAELIEGDGELVVSLSAAEKLEAAHGDLHIPLSAIAGVEILDDVRHAVPGWKSVGAAWPGRFYIGTFHADGSKTFAAVHHDQQRGVRVRLRDANFDELVVGCDDPEAVAESLADHP